MIKNSLEIINDSVKCSSCEEEGHKLESVLVKDNVGYRTLKFCICCGSSLIRRNLDCMVDHKQSFDSSGC